MVRSIKQKVAFRAIKHLNFDKNKKSIVEDCILTQVKKTDLNSVLELNQKFLPAVGHSDLTEMNHFLEISSYFKILKVEEKPVEEEKPIEETPEIESSTAQHSLGSIFYFLAAKRYGSGAGFP